MAKSEKTLFEKYINVKYKLMIDKNVKGEILGWAGNFLCGYVQNLDPLLDCSVIPCVWDLHGRCLFDLKHQEAYDLEKF